MIAESKYMGCVVRHSLKPQPCDPADGDRDAFVKYSKLRPDFGLENVFECPLLMLGPAASFRTKTPLPFLGGTIPMEELLGRDIAYDLRAQGHQAVQFAFGLAVPFPFTYG